MSAFWTIFWVNVAEVALAWGYAEMVWGGCGGPDVQVPNCR